MYKNNYLKVISYLSIIALLVSLYLVFLHYTPEPSTFCNVSKSVNCDIVNKSSYSELFNIPVSILGALTFIGILLISEILQKNKTYKLLKHKITPRHLYLLLITILTWSIFFAIYLLYIEFFVLYAICLFCVVLDILILEMFILTINAHGGGNNALKSVKKTRKKKT